METRHPEKVILRLQSALKCSREKAIKLLDTTEGMTLADLQPDPEPITMDTINSDLVRLKGGA